MTPALRLVLGDQLSHSIASLKDIDAANDAVLMCEVMAEATYVRHHQKKIAFILSRIRPWPFSRVKLREFSADFSRKTSNRDFSSRIDSPQRPLRYF